MIQFRSVCEVQSRDPISIVVIGLLNPAFTNRDIMLKSADAAQLLTSDDSTAGGIAWADTTLFPFSTATHGAAKYES